jgi:D-3-phosphoglycerate dehydrogenase / 2-oxoglutarate reductase
MLDFVMAVNIFGGPDVETEAAAGRATVRAVEAVTPDDLARETADADGLIVTTNVLSAEHLAALGPKVRVIGRAGIGLDAIDLEAAAQRGIAVINQPDYATNEVATHAVAMLLALQRELVQADRRARRPWGTQEWLSRVAPLETLTLGLVGLGRIGRAVAVRALPLVGRVLAYDPQSPELPEGVAPAASLDELLASSDLVSLHLPLLPETEKLIGPDALAKMRPGALLVNVSRGALLDEEAVAAALTAGTLGGAALDVFAHEPLDESSPLLSAPRTLLSPHVAWYSTASGPRVRRDTVEDMLCYLETGAVRRGRLAATPVPA